MLVDIISGSRSDFIRIAPIIEAIQKESNKGIEIRYRLIYIGPHYNKEVMAALFQLLSIPKPHINIEVQTISPAEESAFVMVQYEKVIQYEKPNTLILISGSTAAMGCAIAAKKFGNINVAHIEAGIRTFDMTRQEEINRVVTDSIADYFFTSSHVANENLRITGILEERIFIVGNTLVDTLLKHASQFQRPPVWSKLELQAKNYIILSLQQRNNIEHIQRLKELLVTIIQASKGLPVLLAVNSHVGRILQEIGLKSSNLYVIDTSNYLHTNYLLHHSKVIITDSINFQEEATMMHIPCLTLLDCLEKPETCSFGTNALMGQNHANITNALEKIFLDKWKHGNIPYMWDGRAGERIIEVIKHL